MVPTIFARASGGGRAGVAVFRISGPKAGPVLEKLTGARGAPRFARRVTLRRAAGGFLDDGLAIWFPGPASFTGEDVAELHLHGSPAVERLLRAEMGDMGVVPAEPGAFTLRAFRNGKMDLTQVEALGSLLEAETERQHDQAASHYRGKLRDKADSWRSQLIRAWSQLDAAVDFPDEDDVPADIAERAAPLVAKLVEDMNNTLLDAPAARRLAEGIKIALIGPPNAGKSSLFNLLLAEERAIVSREAGTTRDVVSAIIDMSGYQVTLYDTAGIHDSSGSAIEREGMERARMLAKEADLRLLCYPAGHASMPPWLEALQRPGDLFVSTKADLTDMADIVGGHGTLVAISDPETIARLVQRMTNRLGELAQPGLAVTDRQLELLRGAHDRLAEFSALASQGPELASEILRQAAHELERLTGRIAPDDILGDIFSSFCIGK